MMRKKILSFLFITIASFNFTSIALSDKQPIVRFYLESDQEIYEIDEEIFLSGVIKNFSSQLVYIQTLRPFSTTKITIKTPNGKTFLLVDDRGPFVPTDYSTILPGEEIEYFTLTIRPDELEEKNTAGIEPFMQKGQYEIGYSYQDLTPLLKRALKGTFSSEPINIEIVSLERIDEIAEIKENIEQKIKAIETELQASDSASLKQELKTRHGFVSKAEAATLAKKYIKNQRAYRGKDVIYLFTSDSAERGYWIVGFEEAESRVFHAIKVDERTGRTEETYFID